MDRASISAVALLQEGRKEQGAGEEGSVGDRGADHHGDGDAGGESSPEGWGRNGEVMIIC